MTKYRKKPIINEAFKFGIDPIPDWFMDGVTTTKVILYCPTDVPKDSHYCDIKTLAGIMTGIMTGDYGDYIIKDDEGEIYPCKPDIFEKTYEKIK